ncbi:MULTISPECIES: YidC/Oxa1 family membrane protein insertase [unclassified Streptomyces]|uniref:YidC/Oxa1 family membrane protein insertase n=1 Tax=unclassified Streptomyces TaxID=2593676 RepID=UPI00166087F1|nr:MULTISPECIES: membrane protein insertase YidC [unclassified Streptomyces]
MSVFASLVEWLAELLRPLFAGAATAAAIVLFTALVRLAIHPLSRASARGQKARTRIAPQLAEIRRKHAKNPERLRKEMLALHEREKVSPFAGLLPGLLQAPAFLLMYHLFSGGRMAGHALLAAPLGGRWADALAHGGPFGPAGRVYLALFALAAAVATYGYLGARKRLAEQPLDPGPSTPGAGALAKVMPLLSFGTLVTVAVVPLAAALYIVTSTTWTVVERALLFRDETGHEAEKTGKGGETGGVVAKARTTRP